MTPTSELVMVPPQVVLMAFRYGLGRQTPAHYEALQLVKDHWPQLAPWRETIAADLTAEIRLHKDQRSTRELAEAAQETLDWVAYQPDVPQIVERMQAFRDRSNRDQG